MHFMEMAEIITEKIVPTNLKIKIFNFCSNSTILLYLYKEITFFLNRT